MAETYKESFKVAGQQLVDAVKKLVHEGNVRRVIIKQTSPAQERACDGRTRS